MKTPALISCFFCLVFPAATQPTKYNLDSISKVINGSSNDSIHLDWYRKLGIYYDDVNLDSAVYYGDKAAAIARRLNLKLNEANIITNMGWPLGKMGNYPRALKLLNQAMEIANNPAIENNAVHLPPGTTPHIYRLTVLSYVQNAMASLYGYTGNYKKQISWAKEAMIIAELIKDSLQLAFICPDLGVSYLKLNQLDSAIFYELATIKYYSAESAWDKKFSAEPYLYLGQIYMQKGDLKRSKEYFEKTIQVCEQQNNLAKKGEAHLQLARLFQHLNKLDSSLFHAKKALEMFHLVGKGKSMAMALRAISDYYSEQGHTDSSFVYLNKSTLLNDSLNKTEKEKLSEFQLAGFDETLKLQALDKEKTHTQNLIRTYALLAGLMVFLILAFILYRNNRQKQKTNRILEKTLSELKSTQSQLIQSEKMASLGELTAGIAHEIQNPLNFVNNFSEVNGELIKEFEIAASSEPRDPNNESEIISTIKDNSEKINHHGKRADAIVKSMLQHAKANGSDAGKNELTDINQLAEEYLRLAYHGYRAKDKDFNCLLQLDLDPKMLLVNVIPQDIARVLLNLFNNAFWACTERSKSEGVTLKSPPHLVNYTPTVTLVTKNFNNKIEITVKDNGPGIPPQVLDKIFQPFFTTKPTGQGIGLGLSLAYDIVKAHGGSISIRSNYCAPGEVKIESKEESGSEFIIKLPMV